MSDAIHRVAHAMEQAMVNSTPEKAQCSRDMALILARAAVEECATVIDEMRQREAAIFDEKHSGQRGCDRSDALYDAYQALKALANSSGHHNCKTEI